MYSALVKLWDAFEHLVAMLIFAVLMVALAAALLESPVEILEAAGNRWAHRVMVYFVEGH